MTATLLLLNEYKHQNNSNKKKDNTMLKLLRVPALVGCILLLSVVVTLATEFKYHVFQTNISISASRTSAVITIGHHQFNVGFPSDVGNPQECGNAEICVGWGNAAGPVLLIQKDKASQFSMWKFSIKNSAGATFSIQLNGDNVYGGPVGFNWPGNENQMMNSAYVTGLGSTGAVAETYWFTSGGIAVNVDYKDHLFVSQNSQELTLQFENQMPYPSTNTSIKFHICLGENAKDAFACFPQTPRQTDSQMIKDPIWSTWVRYKANISQDKIMDFANEIRDNGFGISTMEIDDKWETCYGNHQWDTQKFPDPRSLVSKLKARGMYVTLWVHPFINVECDFFKEAEPYLYKLPDGSVGTTTWWNGEAGLIDFTNPKAAKWFKTRLLALKNDVGLTGFKFDAGEAKYIPGISNGTTIIPVPNEYTRKYVELAASLGTMGEVRVGAKNTKTPLFQRLQDTDTHWEASKGGLRSVIPTTLCLNALGYSAVIPDMVGGNLYTAGVDKELFIRWLQLNTFLPVIQFSIAPWDIDNETVTLSRTFTQLHAEFSDVITKEIEGNIHKDGHRVITPVWWHSPNDKTALTIDSEFLLGTNILVAPVVEKGALSRDVYLPDGVWFDQSNGTTYTGPITIKNYPAPLSVLPYFIRLSS